MILNENNEQLENLRKKILAIIQDANNKTAQAKEEWIKDTLLKYAYPPIKGEITKGKIKWRGIDIRFYHEPNNFEKHSIYQRHKQIGLAFCVEYPNESNSYTLKTYLE